MISQLKATIAQQCNEFDDLDVKVSRDGPLIGVFLSITNDEFPAGVIHWGTWRKSIQDTIDTVVNEAIPTVRTDIEAVRLGRSLDRQLSADVLMEPMMSAVALHECIGHTSEADNYGEYQNRLGLKLGDRWSSSDLTIIDDPTLTQFCGSYSLDSEQVSPKPVTLVKDGEWLGLLGSRDFPDHTGASTGHGRRSQAGLPIYPRGGVMMAAAGELTPSDLHGSISDGFLLGWPRHAGSVREFVVLKPLWARRIRHGQLTDEVYIDLVIRAKKTQLMRRLSGIGAAVHTFDPFFMCGKYDQKVRVSMGAPHLLFEKILLYPDRS